MEIKKLLLIGGGGHCLSIIDSLDTNLYDEVAIIDSNLSNGIKVNNVTVIGSDEDLKECYDKGFKYAFISVGSIGNTAIRKRLANQVIDIGFQLVNVIDKTAILSKFVKLGCGVYIGKNVVINANTVIGNNCILNTSSLIEHECIVGDFTHISPGAVILGNCKIENDVHIGANSTILQNIFIHSHVLIGMGSIVRHDIEKGSVVYGFL